MANKEKANITSFPAFFKDKQHAMYVAFFSENEIINISMAGFSDWVRRDSYTINVLPDQEHFQSLVPITEEEFGAAMTKAQELQREWYEKKLHNLTTNIPEALTGY